MVHRSQVAGRGYTLLELLVTLAVIGLLAGLTVPVVARTSATLRTRAEVAGFSAMLRHARERAVSTRRPHAVVVDPDGRRLTLVAGTDEVRERRSLSEGLAIEATPPPALTVRFEPHGASSGGDFRLLAGAAVWRVTVDPVTGRVRSQRQ